MRHREMTQDEKYAQVRERERGGAGREDPVYYISRLYDLLNLNPSLLRRRRKRRRRERERRKRDRAKKTKQRRQAKRKRRKKKKAQAIKTKNSRKLSAVEKMTRTKCTCMHPPTPTSTHAEIFLCGSCAIKFRRWTSPIKTGEELDKCTLSTLSTTTRQRNQEKWRQSCLANNTRFFHQTTYPAEQTATSSESRT